jgi:hypothetical protein
MTAVGALAGPTRRPRVPAAVVDATIAHERNAHHRGTPLGVTPRTRIRNP